MNQFKKDLERSHKEEVRFAEYLKSKYKLDVEIAPAVYHPAWDISSTAVTSNRIITFELKHQDLVSYKDDVIAIESGKWTNNIYQQTCINLSSADYYCITTTTDDSFQIIPTAELLRYCKESKAIKKNTIITNDGCVLHLFDRCWLQSKMKTI